MDFLDNIQLKKHLLTKNELKACEAILENMILVQKLSFTELSEKVQITKASILRFCKKIGYSGYNEFRYECIKYVNSINNVPSDEKKEVYTSIKKVSNVYSNILSLMDRVLKEEDVLKLVDYIKSSKRIRAVGAMNSSIPCWQIRYAFLMFGIEISVINSAEELKSVDLTMNEDDLTIIFSVSAKHDCVNKAIEVSKSVGAKMALVTMNTGSELKKEVDAFITLPSVSNLKNESLLNSVPIFSVFIEILIFYYNS